MVRHRRKHIQTSGFVTAHILMGALCTSLTNMARSLTELGRKADERGQRLSSHATVGFVRGISLRCFGAITIRSGDNGRRETS